MPLNKTLIIALGALCAAPAFSQDDLANIQTDTAIYKAKTAREQARASFAKAQLEADNYSTTARNEPVALWVEGVGSNMSAMVRFEDGEAIEVRVGDTVKRQTVTAISASGVTMKQGKHQTTYPLVKKTQPAHQPSIGGPAGSSPSGMPQGLPGTIN